MRRRTAGSPPRGSAGALGLGSSLHLFWLLLLLIPLTASVPGCGKSTDAGDEAASGDSTAVSEDNGDAGDEDEGDDESSPAKTREKTITVNASKVVRGELIVPVVAEGTIRARQSGEIRAEVGGRIERIYVEEGQSVRKGQKIAQLDDRQFQVALEEARNGYLEALGRLAVDEDEIDPARATEQLRNQIQELERLEREGTITRQERQDRELALEVEAIKKGAYRNELVQVRSGLAAARAAQQRAELDLEHTRITAPFAGVISDLTLNAGQMMTANQVICQLVDNVNLEAEVAVLESDLAGLETGRAVALEVPAIQEKLRATVDVMSPRIDSQSRTCKVLIRIRNEKGNLRPGMYVRASIAGSIHPDKLMVPREAILTRDGRPLLFKIEDDRASWVYIEPGLSNDSVVEVAKVLQGGPLDAGTLVVVSDHLTLTHQAKVKVRKVVETKFDLASNPESE